LSASDSIVPDVDGVEERGETPLQPAHRKLGGVFYKYSLIFVWGVVVVFFGVVRFHTFLTLASVQTIFGSQSYLVILTLALIVVLTVGEFDLSVASNLGLVATLVAVLNGLNHMPAGWACLIALAAGVAVGAVNGVLVIRVGVDSLIVTLGMATLLLGAAIGISGAVTIAGISPTLVAVTNYRILTLPLSFYFAMALGGVIWYILSQTPLGRYALFVGQGRDVARLSGIAVDRIRFGAFVASGFLAGLGGLVMIGTLGAYQSSVSGQFLLPAFAAAFLGSTVIEPGRFNAWGSVVAIYFLITGIIGFELLGFSGWIEQVFYGAALIIAVVVSTIVRRRYI
jgi:ribose transport system permease protein